MHTPEENDIRDRAYALWQSDGSPDGRDQEYWHRAEQELAAQTDLDTSEQADEVSQPVPPAGFATH